MDYHGFLFSLSQDVGAIIVNEAFNIGRVEYKDDDSPVTRIDKAVHKLVAKRLAQKFPEDSLFSEEGTVDTGSNRRWRVDPVDGTIPLIRGIPTQRFSMALDVGGEIHVGIVYNPFNRDYVFAEKGKGAFSKDGAVRVRDVDYAPGVGLTAWVTQPLKLPGIHQRLVDESFQVYDFGSCCLHGAYVAQGKLQGMVFPGVTHHDVAAIDLIIREAGGVATDLKGNRIDYNLPLRGFVAGTPQTHTKIMELVGPND